MRKIVPNCNTTTRWVLSLYERRDPTTAEPPHIVDFFHDSHVNKKDEWASAEAESRYERMKELATQNLEESVEPLTQDEIACTVLGSRPGYKKGFGHGLKASSSSQSFRSTAEYREQVDMIKELQATVDSLQKERDETKEKLEKFEDVQQQMMQQLLQMQLQLQRALQGNSTNVDMPPESYWFLLQLWELGCGRFGLEGDCSRECSRDCSREQSRCCWSWLFQLISPDFFLGFSWCFTVFLSWVSAGSHLVFHGFQLAFQLEFSWNSCLFLRFPAGSCSAPFGQLVGSFRYCSAGFSWISSWSLWTFSWNSCHFVPFSWFMFCSFLDGIEGG